MQADRDKLQSKENLVTARGDVTVKQQNNHIKGSTLTLNVETNKARLTDARGTLKDTTVGDSELQGEFFFWGDEVILDENITIRNADISSCDYPRDKRIITSPGEEIIIIPKQKMIVRKGRFFLNNKQIMGLKSLSIPLRPRRPQPASYNSPGRPQRAGRLIREGIDRIRMGGKRITA